MYTIICINGHQRKDKRPRGICTVCGLSMSVKPVVKRKREDVIDG